MIKCACRQNGSLCTVICGVIVGGSGVIVGGSGVIVGGSGVIVGGSGLIVGGSGVVVRMPDSCQSNSINYRVAECFPEKSSWCE